MDENTEFKQLIQERFESLPKVVRDAILSADVQSHMRELAKKRNLHLDQWEALENEVQLTLLGVHHSENLPENIAESIGLSPEEATALAAEISALVFEPIRQELERQLEHPDAEATEETGVEQMRTQVLGSSEAPTAPVQAPAAPAAAPIAPATPPPAPPTQKVERAQLPATYAPQVASHERKAIEGDPYREQLI